jgi:hypothetical protein
MSMRHVRNLKMDEEILCVKYSNNPSKDPRKTLVAVATLDNTVKIYFDDSLKFFLSMYVFFFAFLCVRLALALALSCNPVTINSSFLLFFCSSVLLFFCSCC